MPGFRGANRGTSNQRGYGTAHTKARAAAFAKLPTYSPCCRCGKPMWKWALDPWGKSALHYDHNDSRTGYLGFSHSTCNQRAGAAAGGRAVTSGRPRRNRLWSSRRW